MANEINDPVIMEATYIGESNKAWCLNCEGDEHWFPKSKVNYDKDGESLELPKWMFKQKFPGEPV